MPAEADGALQIRVAEGETIGIGTVIAEIGASGDAAANPTAAPAPAAESKPAADPISQGEQNPQASDQSGYGGSQSGSADTPTATVPAASTPSASGGVREMKIPTVGESITEVTVSKWLKPDGAQVAQDEVIAEIESDKATFNLLAESSGTLLQSV